MTGLRYGTYRPETFEGTQDGIQDMLDYIGVAGHGYIGPGSYDNLTNFTQYAKSRVVGAGPVATLLNRNPLATGTFWREKTSAEGNAGGAVGIILENLGFYGHGSTGDGIDLGNQVGGAEFTSHCYLGHLLVRDFVGKGFKLKANTIRSSDLWSLVNQYGLWMEGGGGNRLYGIWAEDCTASAIYTKQVGDTFFGVHLEDGNASWDGTSPTIDLASAGAGALDNAFIGCEIKVDLARDKLIILRSGLARNHFQFLRVFGGGSWNYTFYSDAWSGGLDSTYKLIPLLIDGQLGVNQASFFRDSGTAAGLFTSLIGASMDMTMAFKEKRFGLTDATTIAVDASRGNFFNVVLGGNRTMGAPTNPVDGQRIEFKILQDGTGGRTLAWNAAFKTNWVDTGNTLNKFSTIAFRYDGANWIQSGAQSAYI